MLLHDALARILTSSYVGLATAYFESPVLLPRLSLSGITSIPMSNSNRSPWSSIFPTRLLRFARRWSHFSKDNLESVQTSQQELCEVCRQNDMWTWSLNLPKQDIKLEHHKSYLDLETAASGGCRICIIFREALLKTIQPKEFSSLSISETENYLEELEPASLYIASRVADAKHYDRNQLEIPCFQGFVLFHSTWKPTWIFPSTEMEFRLEITDGEITYLRTSSPHTNKHTTENSYLPILGRVRGECPDLSLARV